MHQLSANDAMFLYLENATHYGHVGGLQILDAPAMPDVRSPEDQAAHLEAMFELVPFMRRKIRQVPLGLGHPYWVDDPDFDLEYHWRRIRVAGEGNPQDVERLVSRIAARHLDRSKPLWEFYEIEGIDGGTKTGVYTKIHHAAADGAAMVAMAMATLSPTPDIVTNQPSAPWEPETPPTDLELFTRALSDAAARPGKMVSWGRRMLRELNGEQGARERLNQLREANPAPEAPETRFNQRISAHRRWSFGSTPLDEVKAIRKATGATVNDIVLNICAEMLRNWLAERDELPELGLVASVPVNLRGGDATMDSFENQVGAVSGALHTNIADPVERLAKISESMNAQKEMQRALPAELQMDAMGLVPAWAMSQATRLIFNTGLASVQRTMNLTISNVPGPQMPLYTDGALQTAVYPFSTITDGMGLNITVQSYNGNLDWGIVVDRDMVDDAWPMWDGIQKAQKELLAATT